MEKQFIAFKVSGFYYCINIMDVQEVVREKSITYMPNFPSFVEGVINLRGLVVPVISIDKRLCSLTKKRADSFAVFEAFDSQVREKTIQKKEKENSKSAGYKLVIIKVGMVTIGLLVDVLDKILIADDFDVQGTEGMGRSLNHPMVLGVLHQNEDVFVVLNTASIFSSSEESVLNAQFQQ